MVIVSPAFQYCTWQIALIKISERVMDAAEN